MSDQIQARRHLESWVRDQSVMSDHPTKKRKLSRSREDEELEARFDEASLGQDNKHLTVQKPSAVRDNCDDDRVNISLSAMSKAAEQNVAPFLAKHIPGQYTPGRGLEGPNRDQQAKDTSTQYCYRHRPDNKCRRQADDTSMGQLQQVSNPFMNAVSSTRMLTVLNLEP